MERVSRRGGREKRWVRERERVIGRENKNCSITGQTRFFSFFGTSDFAVQINVGRSGCLLLILALQLSNQKLSGNGVVIELHSLD